MSEHTITTNNKATRELVQQLRQGEVPVADIRKKIGRYYTKKAFEDIENIGRQLSVSLKKSFGASLAEVSEAIRGLDVGLKAAFDDLVNDYKVLEFSVKQRNGRRVECVKIRDGVESVSVGGSVMFKVKAKEVTK